MTILYGKRRSRERNGQDQQDLTTGKEEALFQFILQLSKFGFPLRIKFIPYLAHRLMLQRHLSATNKGYACELNKANVLLRFDLRHLSENC